MKRNSKNSFLELADKKRLSEEIFKPSQSWNYTSIWDFMGKKLMIEIKRDAYDFQSYRKVSIFDPTRNCWNFLASLSIETAHCLPISYVQDKEAVLAKKELFRKDEQELLEQARLILS